MMNKLVIEITNNEIARGALEFAERRIILYTMKLTRHNQSKAAKLLGLSRGCLRMKLTSYGYFEDGI